MDAAVEKLEHQLTKLKTKLVSRNHPRRNRGPVLETEADDGLLDPASVAAVDTSRIVRSKQFAMKPMSPEEAVLQMDLLGHDFYFFANAETGRAGVVYRRRSGDIGLIDEAG